MIAFTSNVRSSNVNVSAGRSGKYMKKEKTSKAPEQADDEMLPEYDFRGGVRGKHYKPIAAGIL
jgi:hypothetical protein